MHVLLNLRKFLYIHTSLLPHLKPKHRKYQTGEHFWTIPIEDLIFVGKIMVSYMKNNKNVLIIFHNINCTIEQKFQLIIKYLSGYGPKQPNVSCDNVTPDAIHLFCCMPTKQKHHNVYIYCVFHFMLRFPVKESNVVIFLSQFGRKRCLQDPFIQKVSFRHIHEQKYITQIFARLRNKNIEINHL